MCHLVSVELPADLSAPGLARQVVTSCLEEWGAAAVLDPAVLAASELVTNAVLHASAPIELMVSFDSEAVELGVHDRGPLLAHRHPSPPTLLDEGDQHSALRESGRGLPIIEAVSADFGERPLADGKVVWCRLTPPGHVPVACGCPAPGRPTPGRSPLRLPSGRSITPREGPPLP